MSWRPTIEEQRELALRGEAKNWKRSGLISAEELVAILKRPSNWSTSSLPAWIAYFILGAIGVAAWAWFLNILGDERAVIALVTSIGAAEWLIRKRRWWQQGIEAALWLGGLVAVIVSLPHSGRPEAWLLFAAAALIAGLRVDNAIFLLGSAACVVAYASSKWGTPSVAFWVALAAATLAVAGDARFLKRPLYARFCALAVVLFPLIAYGVAEDISIHRQIGTTALVELTAFTIVAIAFLATGVRRGSNAAIISSLLMIAVEIYQVIARLNVRNDAAFVVSGAALFAIALFVDRTLRRGRRFTSEKIVEARALDTILLAATPILAAPSASSPGEAQHLDTGGGSFGGGGASGSY